MPGRVSGSAPAALAQRAPSPDLPLVLPPYGTDEIAQAVLERLQQCGLRFDAVSVTADDVSRTWRLTARLPDGREIAATYPYSAPEGIHTPNELAEWFARIAV